LKFIKNQKVYAGGIQNKEKQKSKTRIEKEMHETSRNINDTKV